MGGFFFSPLPALLGFGGLEAALDTPGEFGRRFLGSVDSIGEDKPCASEGSDIRITRLWRFMMAYARGNIGLPVELVGARGGTRTRTPFRSQF